LISVNLKKTPQRMSAFRAPIKAIKTYDEFNKFLRSATCKGLVAFIKTLGDSVKGLPCSADVPASDVTLRLISNFA
jgi:hypothetical protein